MLDITSKDYFHLKSIAKWMEAKYKIGIKYTIINGKRYNNFRIQITNNKICEDLRKLGFNPKREILFPSCIPEKFYPDFIRGFFDGDGSIYIYKVNGTTQLKGNFTSKDKRILLWLSRFLSSTLNFPLKKIYQNRRKLWEICLYQKECEKLFRFMYRKESAFCLKRKYKVFESWFLNVRSKANWRWREVEVRVPPASNKLSN
jgi:hypothetical protein